MSTIFLAIASRHVDLRARHAQCARYVPIAQAIAHEAWSQDEQVCLRTWATSAQLDGFFTQAESAGCVQGWWMAPGQGLAREADSVGGHNPFGRSLGRLFAAHGLEQGVGGLEGNWAALHLKDNVLSAATDRMNGEQIFYGEHAGVIAISNRATLAACALHGQLPSPSPAFFAWWLSANMSHMFHHDSPWPHVHALDPRHILHLERHTLSLHARPTPPDSLDDPVALHARRCAIFTRFPGMRAQLALTGGKDSRAVLAGLIASGAHTHPGFERAFIMTKPGHPDAKIAEHLCAHYGIAFENDGYDTQLQGHLFERMRTHLWRTEGLLHAWDLKVLAPNPEVITLNGHFGETYRSHFVPALRAPRPMAVRRFVRDAFVDQHALLQPPMRQLIRARMKQWLALHAEVPRVQLRDVWHRQCRMWKWASAIGRGDALGGMVVNPLASGQLLAMYKAQPQREQLAERTHFELVRGADDWLWRQPFAGATWHKSLIPAGVSLPAPLTQQLWPHHSRQYMDWERHGEQARALLLERANDGGFYEVFTPQGVRGLLDAYERKPDGFALKAIFALLGARIALSQGITSA